MRWLFLLDVRRVVRWRGGSPFGTVQDVKLDGCWFLVSYLQLAWQATEGLACTTPRAMPANNLLLRFVKAERGPLQKMLSWAGVEELVL